jgi:acyl-coenzyme A thioesterase PaaI-like protein
VGRVIKKGHSVAFMEGMVTNSDDGSRLSETVASFVIMPKRRKE